MRLQCLLPTEAKSCLWRVPVTNQSVTPFWDLRRRTRTFLQDRINPHQLGVSHSSIAETLVLVQAAWAPSPRSCLAALYPIPNREGFAEG